MSDCQSLQERLADEGAALLARDRAIREHVAGCEACSAFVHGLQRLDQGLSRLAPLSAPSSLRARTARAVAGLGPTPTSRAAGDPGQRKLAAALAATVILAAGFVLTESVQQELDALQGFYAQQSADSSAAPGYRAQDRANPASVATMAPAPSRAPVGGAISPSPISEADQFAAETLEHAERALDALSQRANAPGTEETARALESPSRTSVTAQTGPAPFSKEQKKRDRDRAGEARQSASVGLLSPSTPADDSRESDELLSPEQVARHRRIITEAGLASASSTFGDAAPAAPSEDRGVDADGPTAELLPQSLAEPLLEPLADNKQMEGNRGPNVAAPGKAGRLAGVKNEHEAAGASSAGGAATGHAPLEVARRFLAEQERLKGLRIQSASGYWANTYIPGDPGIRLLEARLQGWDRQQLRAKLGDARLEAAARQNWQPFDLPRNAALAVYLHADKRALHGPSRLRVQVGLQASQKRSGLRPDMNVGVVLDLRRPLDEATGAKVRALVMALARARQPGDRFSITVAGHPGGLLIAPQEFRHGPIQVAMQSLFAPDTNVKAPAMDLLAALQSASDNVRQGDDASAPLGASLVLLVSTAPIAEQSESLERMAHENAVAGIGLSVVAVGGGTDLASIDRLVLLGQGHRRVLTGAEDAMKLVDRELHAASRAVARAVRLRIRLAPGVELIDVLGSENLSEQAAQRVRDAERSIDQRVARNIGIRADRGKDEEGIQIVIPSFFAGDSHAVLLDVLVPGPGPVAEVSVRYKDLVYRRNGVASARLTTDDGPITRGPLEYNVIKNQLAYELARSASAASHQLGAGDAAGAVRTLTRARDLISGMRAAIPGWDNDTELGADEMLLSQYLQVLGPRFAAAGQDQQRLADSLRYLAFRRLVPPHK